MPIYEYQCGACEHRFDALQKMSDDPLTICPECGADSLKKLLSAPRFRLKGSGWYETDFKGDNKRNLADSQSTSAKTSTGTDSGSGDSGDSGAAKTESKSDSKKSSNDDKAA